jgi:hypothetical protein
MSTTHAPLGRIDKFSRTRTKCSYGFSASSERRKADDTACGLRTGCKLVQTVSPESADWRRRLQGTGKGGRRRINLRGRRRSL